MRLAALVALVAFPALADDPGMTLTMVMMRSPAMSADGKHIALYSDAPGDEKDSKTSLAVFGSNGKLEMRIGVVPPAVDMQRATADAAKVMKVLNDGSYARMGRMASKGGAADKSGGYSIDLSSGDVAFTLKIANRKVSITGTRGEKKLKPIELALPAKDGTCTGETTFSVANTMAGYDPKSQLFAFEVIVFAGDSGCFAHPFVVALK